MIRRAKHAEIEQIMLITRACASKMIANKIYQWNEYYPHKAAFDHDYSRNELFVLVESNKVIGSITISSEKDLEYDSIDWLTEDSLQFYIHRLAVHPDFQHQGNAKKLMDFAENHAREQSAISIRLDTFSQNKRNQEFYKARGYKQLGNIYFPKQSDFPFYCYELVL